MTAAEPVTQRHALPFGSITNALDDQILSNQRRKILALLDGRFNVAYDDVRQAALAKLMTMQQQDFEGIFEAMDGLPVIIRLLDPPLHEFLPHTDDEMKELAGIMGVDFQVLKRKTESLNEFNPMLGHRGCRLGITYPEIYEMQARAIFEATIAASRDGEPVVPEVMIPLVSAMREEPIERRDHIGGVTAALLIEHPQTHDLRAAIDVVEVRGRVDIDDIVLAT